MDSSNPNDDEPVQRRDHLLWTIFQPPRSNRSDEIVRRAKGHRVLNIGCVNHDLRGFGEGASLHEQLATVSSELVGTDINVIAIEELSRRGFEVLIADVEQPPSGRLADRRFDVVVAGEIIEHLGRPIAVFEFAAHLLEDDGLLIISTPNPYAPHRSSAGLSGLTWENVDHTLYIFPSGIAEMAKRTGFQLCCAYTVGLSLRRRAWKSALGFALSWRDFARGHRRRSLRNIQLPLSGFYANPLHLIGLTIRGQEQFSRETFIYELRRTSDNRMAKFNEGEL